MSTAARRGGGIRLPAVLGRARSPHIVRNAGHVWTGHRSAPTGRGPCHRPRLGVLSAAFSSAIFAARRLSPRQRAEWRVAASMVPNRCTRRGGEFLGVGTRGQDIQIGIALGMASAFTTSPSCRRASAIASLVLPLAVGPWMRIAGRMPVQEPQLGAPAVHLEPVWPV